MKLRQLGSLMVSEICLGSMTFGGQLPAWDARQVLDYFVHHGGNFVDTANEFNQGKAEEIIGQWMTDGRHRPHMIISTKTYAPEDGDPNHRRLSRHAILYSVEQSLRRLQTDYIDIYGTHYWDVYTPLEETLSTMEMLIQQGKVRYVACSNYFAWQVMKAVGIQKYNQWSPFVALHAQYSLIERSIEYEILGLLQSEKLGLLAWSPLAGGFLTGKHTLNRPFDEKTRFGQQDRMADMYRTLADNERGWQILEAVQDIARGYNMAPEQVAIAWVLSRTWVNSVIIGVSQLEQIDVNLAAAELELASDDLRTLDRISTVPIPYPGYIVQP